MHRRSVLAALPISAAAVTIGFGAPLLDAPTSILSPSPELVALAAAHRKAWEVFGETCDGADPHSDAYLGEAGEEARDAACAAEERAMAAVMVWPAVSYADRLVKAEHLRWVQDHCGGIACYADAILEAVEAHAKQA